MEVRHSRTPSFPSLPRPTMGRRGSNASEAGSVMTSASELTEHPHQPSGSGPNLSAPQQPATPLSISVPPTPNAAANMNPPPSSGKASSRRSSFSSQQAASPSLSVTALGRGRSPSPIPPLPAMRAAVAPPASITQRLYAEENATRFFRRLTFSPDGSLLLTPAGQIEDQIFKGSPMMSGRSLSTDGVDGNPAAHRPKAIDTGRPTVFIYSRANLARNPIAHLPGHKTAAVAIRFSPIFYDLRTVPTPSVEPKQVTLDRSNPGPVHVSLQMPPPPPKEGAKETKQPPNSIFALPYRLLYAVACQDAVLLYDTQQAGPIAIFKGLHYAGFTDIAWSADGQSMLLSSQDGYCSLVVFDQGELGTVHPTQQHHRQLAAIAQSHGGASTPMPHSPNVSTMRTSPAPPRSERESSAASSAPVPPPRFGGGQRPPSSSVSSVDQPLPTPADEPAEFNLRRASESSADEASVKRETPSETEQPKKKRRVALTHLSAE